MNYGLSRDEVKATIKRRLNENPDIFYFMDNDYIEELVEALSNGVADAIELNNKKFIDDMNWDLKSKSMFRGHRI